MCNMYVTPLGKVNFISTLNTGPKGYWQVPVAEKDRHKTCSLYNLTIWIFANDAAVYLLVYVGFMVGGGVLRLEVDSNISYKGLLIPNSKNGM